MAFWHWVFWLSEAYVFYTYLGYPLLLLAARLIVRARGPALDPGFRPLVSVVLTVRNEAGHIERKLENFREQDYPADRLEIWVASDHSTDETDEVVRRCAERDPRVRLLAFEEHVGKS